MLRRISFFLIAALLGTCLTLGMGSAKAFAVTEIEGEWNLFLPDQKAGFDYFNARLASEAGISLVMEKVPAGGSAYLRAQDGTIAVGMGIANQTDRPEGDIFLGVPFGYDPAGQVAWLLNGGGLGLERNIYAEQGIVPVPVAVYPESGGWFLEAIPETLDGFKAKDYYLRWYGIGAEILKAVHPGIDFATAVAGSVPLSYFGANAPDEESMLNGFEFSSPNNDYQLLFLDQPTKKPRVVNPNLAAKEWAEEEGIQDYNGPYYYNAWHQPAQIYELWFSKDFWDNELTQEQRATILNLSRESLVWCVENIKQDESLALMQTRKNGGIFTTNIEWPPEVLGALRAEAIKKYNGYMDESSGNYSMGTVLESMIEFGWDLYPEQ